MTVELPPPGTVLCALSDLDATGAKGISLDGNAGRAGIFVVRDGAGVFGYVNSCPHIGVPLELEPDEFISDIPTKSFAPHMVRVSVLKMAFASSAPARGICWNPLP